MLLPSFPLGKIRCEEDDEEGEKGTSALLLFRGVSLELGYFSIFVDSVWGSRAVLLIFE